MLKVAVFCSAFVFIIFYSVITLNRIKKLAEPQKLRIMRASPKVSEAR